MFRVHVRNITASTLSAYVCKIRLGHPGNFLNDLHYGAYRCTFCEHVASFLLHVIGRFIQLNKSSDACTHMFVVVPTGFGLQIRQGAGLQWGCQLHRKSPTLV